MLRALEAEAAWVAARGGELVYVEELELVEALRGRRV